MAGNEPVARQGCAVDSRHIRANANLRAIPIIAVTALVMPGDRERCFAAGANDYLTKPVSLRLLHETIDKHLRQSKELQHDNQLNDSNLDH